MRIRTMRFAAEFDRLDARITQRIGTLPAADRELVTPSSTR